MGFFELLGIGFVLYYVVQFVLWCSLDSDIELFVKEKTGKPIAALRHKVVWITGASSGIGRALALELARNGVRLCLSARREPELNAVRRECLTQSNGSLSDDDVLVVPMDMLRIDDHQRHFDRVLEHFGGTLDVLVNNAGRSQRANWQDVALQVDREMFDIDVFAVVHLTRLYLRHVLLRQAGTGHVAVTSSSAGLIGVPGSCSYVGAKFALHGYFECLRVEQPQLDVTIFCPGPTATEFLASAFTDRPNELYVESLAQPGSRRMSADRCARLMAVAIANRLHLNYVGPFPVPLLLSVVLYHPNVKKLLMRLMGAGGLNRIRDPEKAK